MTLTYKEAAQAALDCQDACNLSGVAKFLAGPVMDALWAEARRIGQGTEWINRHPVVALMLDKLASLNRTQCLCGSHLTMYGGAYDTVLKITQGVSPECAQTAPR